MEGEKVMVVLRVETGGFEAEDEFFSIFGVLDEVIDGEVLSSLANYRSCGIIALPVVRIVVAVE